jgi:acetyl esterase
MPVDEQVQQVLECFASFGAPSLTALSPQDARRRPTIVDAVTTLRWRRGETIAPEMVGAVRDELIPGPEGEIRVRLYRPESGERFPILVYFHAGGWVLGDVDRCDSICRSLTNLVQCVIVSVDYRLAPEHPFPAAVQDAFTATQWALTQGQIIGGDPTRVAVAGEGAGGNLAAVVAQMARDSNAPRPVYQVLIYPILNHAFDTASYERFSHVRPLTRSEMRWFWSHYLPTAAAGANCYASPLQAEDLRDLPPGLILTAEYDVVRDEGEEYGRRLEEAGVPMLARRCEGLTHGFLEMAPVVERAQDALGEIAYWLRSVFSVHEEVARADQAAQGEEEHLPVPIQEEMALADTGRQTPSDRLVSNAPLHEDATRGETPQASAAKPARETGYAPLESGQVLRVGMEVIGSDGQRMGRVKEVRASDFVVDRWFRRAVALPFEAIHVASDRVVLTVPAKDASRTDWSLPPL